MLNCANIYRISRFCLPFEELHKPAVPSFSERRALLCKFKERVVL